MLKSKKMPLKLLSAVIGLGILASVPMETSYAEKVSSDKVEINKLELEDSEIEESLDEVNLDEDNKEPLEEYDDSSLDDVEEIEKAELDHLVTETTQVKSDPVALADNSDDEEIDMATITDEQINKIFDSLTYKRIFKRSKPSKSKRWDR